VGAFVDFEFAIRATALLTVDKYRAVLGESDTDVFQGVSFYPEGVRGRRDSLPLAPLQSGQFERISGLKSPIATRCAAIAGNLAWPNSVERIVTAFRHGFGEELDCGT